MTRPQVVVDETNEIAYVLYTSPENTGSGDQAIYYKSAPLSTLNFNAAGLGTALISDAGQDINNVSTAKHGVTAASGLLAIASADTNMSLLPRLPVAGERPHPPLHRHRRHAVRGRHRLAVGRGHHDRLHSHKFCPKDPVRAARWPRSWLGPSICRRRWVTTSPTTMGLRTRTTSIASSRRVSRLAAQPRSSAPKDPVTRGQMSTFLIEPYVCPRRRPTTSTDDNGTAHEATINRIFEAGIITGCGPRTGLPQWRREPPTDAHFLHRALTFPGPLGLQPRDGPDHPPGLSSVIWQGWLPSADDGCARRVDRAARGRFG